MSDIIQNKHNILSREQLERELNLKQLQINRLLNITQAINSNVKANGLFSMYNSFLGWEIGVQKMALYYKKDESWTCATSIGISEEDLSIDISHILPQFERTHHLNGIEHPLLKHFELVIPVLHKSTPIAYTFIGGLGGGNDLYNRVQFITTITNIIAVAIENKRLFKRQLDQERLKREMELAREMQMELIPKNLPDEKNFELASIYQPHLGVGGDYFDFIQFKDDKIAFCVGDISGKGVAAALLMANFQANFHTLIRKRDSLDDFIREINASLVRTTKGDKFVTFFVAQYDVKHGELMYVNAGHNPPYMVSDGKLFRLDQGCTLLGVFKELPYVTVGRVKVNTDALVMSFTDGLSDLQNSQGEYLSEKYLGDFVLKHHKRSAREFNQLLLNYIEGFNGSQAYHDDFTILTCKLTARA